MLGLSLSSKVDCWGSYLVSIAKTAFYKVGALIHSIKFYSSEAARYHFVTLWCLAGACGCYLGVLDKLQKQVM